MLSEGRFIPLKGRTTFEGGCPCFAEGPTEEKVQGVGGIVPGRCQTYPHSVPQIHSAPGIAAQWSEQADVTPVTSAMQCGR